MAKATGKSTGARKGATKAAPAKAAKRTAATKKTAAKKAAPAGKVPAKSTRKVAKPAVKKVPAKAVRKTPAKAAKKVAKAPAKKAAPVRKKASPAAKKVAKPAAKKTAPAKAKPAPKPKKQPAGKTCPLSGIFVPKQSANISPKTLEKLRELRVEARARHRPQSVELQADADMLVAEREQGDTQFDEESGEGDTISVERERDLMLSANARQAVDEIDRALDRMKNGTYGLCVPAGRKINVARLEAIPWAEFCVDCKQRVERPRR
jgi:RNA polymerase-binding transcription factor DksA